MRLGQGPANGFEQDFRRHGFADEIKELQVDGAQAGGAFHVGRDHDINRLAAQGLHGFNHVEAVLEAAEPEVEQANGEGLQGAFPPLKGSPVVLDDNAELMVDIIMNGYDARPNYGVMAAVGTNANLTPEEVAAIMNHEKTTWGNNAKKLSPEEVKKVMEFVKLKAPAN